MNSALPSRLSGLRQRHDLPSAPRAIAFIGAGGIVNDAHMPAYRRARFPIAGVFDLDRARAEQTAGRWEIPRVFGSLREALGAGDVVFDIALPPAAVLATIEQLPDGAVALIQKPLGEDLADATRIREVCRRKRITAAVNFQLRFSPMMLAVSDAIERGLLGRIVELEVHVNCRMPWELWPFMESLRRMEIALHSIHYLDCIRSMLGEPRSVFARTVKHPAAAKLASSRTSAILDYGDDVRCCLSVNHHHAHGPKHQTSSMRIEGERGAAVVTMGVNLDYPKGRPDALEIALDGSSEWHSIPLSGNWFPDAFEGTMSNLQRFAAGEDARLITSVEDAWHTMALVEALYESDAHGGTPLPRDPSPRRAGDCS
jgi:predicted dehydrogenase